MTHLYISELGECTNAGILTFMVSDHLVQLYIVLGGPIEQLFSSCH